MAELLSRGLTGAEIARALGISKPTVCFHLRMLGVPPSVEFAQRYDWEAIRKHYEAGHSMTQCMAAFGFSRNAWWDAIRRGVISPRPKAEPIEDVFCRGRRRNRNHLKIRLLGAGLKEQRCELCGLSEWQGRPLAGTAPRQWRWARQPTRESPVPVPQLSQPDRLLGRQEQRKGVES